VLSCACERARMCVVNRCVFMRVREACPFACVRADSCVRPSARVCVSVRVRVSVCVRGSVGVGVCVRGVGFYRAGARARECAPVCVPVRACSVRVRECIATCTVAAGYATIGRRHSRK
jgi:hypothetical protein